MKYRILKALDVTGFTFLTPIVRLCYGEEPRTQLKKIAQFIVVPVLAVAAFVLLWSQIAPRHKTKSGEVPTPAVVWKATQGIWTFHQREGAKEAAYELTGETRQQRLTAVQNRLSYLMKQEADLSRRVKTEELNATQWLRQKLQPLELEFAAAELQATEKTKTLDDTIAALAAALQPGDVAGHESLLRAIRQRSERSQLISEQLNQLKVKQDQLRSESYPPLVVARSAQTELAEEKQFLTKMAEQLSRANREARVLEAKVRVDSELSEFHQATGTEAVRIAARITQAEDRVQTTVESRYARPWTLPDQIKRSLACAFFGFLLGSAIAIPIGVLCGLSPVFMSAMTPFVALFKPVSPIVWLPIALIIVGGFIPDPDKHWLISLLASVPLIGRLQINPAFIASGVTVALCSLWPTLVNTALGVASIDRDHMNVARVLRLGFWSRMFRIVIPSALPLIFAGLRISLGVGWMVLIAAELLSSSEGLGKFIWDQFNNGASDSFARMVAVVFVVGAIGFLLDRIMIIFQRLVSFDGAPAAM